MVTIKDGSKINRDALEHLRKRAIRLWENKKKVVDISFDFGVSRIAVYNWINTYKKKGINGLDRKKALGAKPKLSSSEVKRLLKIIEKTAEKYGYETPLWNCTKIQQIILEKFNKNIHNCNIWRLLKRKGLSFQKPEKEASEKDEEEVEAWMREVLPKIKRHARRWQAILYFQDESSVQLTPSIGKTWAPKGKTPKVKVTGKRGSICVTSAISPAGRMLFRLEKEKVNACVHIEFLKQIIQSHPNRKIIVVEDQAPVHIAKKVDQFVEENKKRFGLYYFPSYSPDLNPDEHVWGHLKNHELKTHQVKSMKDFRPFLLSKMRSIQRRKPLVKTFFYDSFVN